MISLPCSIRAADARLLLQLSIALTALPGCYRNPPLAQVGPVEAKSDYPGDELEAARHAAWRGASANATADEFGSMRGARVEELLRGRFTGVEVVSTVNGGFSVRIRGVNTLMGDAEPLYVIDGMPVHVVPGQGLDWINPADIERIDVLKDAASTSLYGMRGSNGVILITTRRAR